MTDAIWSELLTRVVRDRAFLVVFLGLWTALAAAFVRSLRPSAASPLRATVLRWGLAGLLIRLTVMPFTMHPDFIFVQYFPSLLASGGVLNLYEHLRVNYLESIRSGGWIYYPPMTYYSLGLSQVALRPLMPEFQTWIDALGRVMLTGGSSYLQAFDSPYLFRYLFVLKLPYLAFDMAAGALLLRATTAAAASPLWAFKAWTVNPITIYSIFVAGRFEIMPACVLLGSLVAVQYGRRIGGAVALGLSAAFNNIPALCGPALCAGASRRWTTRIVLALAGAAPYLLLFVLLYPGSHGFVIHIAIPPLYQQQVNSTAPAVRSMTLMMLFAVAGAAYVWWLVGLPRRTSVVSTVLLLAVAATLVSGYAWRLHLGVAAYLVVCALVCVHGWLTNDLHAAIAVVGAIAVFDVGFRAGAGAALLLAVYGLLALHARRETAVPGVHLAVYYVIVLCTAFTLVTTSFFWFVTVTPFLALWLGDAPAARPLVLAQCLALAAITLYHGAMLGGLLAPIAPAAAQSIPDMAGALGDRLPRFLLNGAWSFRIASWAVVGYALGQLFKRPPIEARPARVAAAI